MAKRYQFLQDLLAATSKLPWRIAVGLAVLSYLTLYLIADIFEEPPMAGDLANLVPGIARQAIYVAAFIMQFILPLAFLSGLGATLFKRLKQIRIEEAPPDYTPAVVRTIGWREFELLICEAFRREGYRVEERGKSGPDNEIDLIATKAKKRLLIQCKHWKTPQVSVAVIRDLDSILTARRADGGVLVTGGTCTKEARDFAEARRIRLIDGDALEQMIGSEQSRPAIAPAVAVAPSAAVAAAPACPKCGAGMVDRVAKQGKFAGKHFWVCGQYPKFTGIATVLESDEEPQQRRLPARLSTG